MQQAIFSTRSLDESLWRYVGDKLEVIVWTLVRQWRQMRVLMRPEAAFPYVFAAEGAQHPPIARHAQRSPPNNRRSTNPPQRKKESISKKSPVQCLTESDFFVWSL